MKQLFIVSLLLGLFAVGQGAKCPKHKNPPGKEIFCYTSTYDVQRLQDSLCGCTTLIHQGHGFSDFNASGLGAFQEALKDTNPDLKFVISVDDLQSVVNTSPDDISDELATFLQTADGIEINATAGSKERLNHFVRVIRNSMKRNGTEKLLVVALPGKSETLAKFYDLKELSKYVDKFTVSTHYLKDEDESYHTFHPARLMGMFDMLNADSLVDLINGLGAPKDKIIISVPANAYKFALNNTNENAPRSPTKEEQPVALDRKELCELLNSGEWTIERDDDLTGPYAFQNDTWIAFDDKISLAIKVKYILLRELAGLGIRNIENDLRSDCGNPLSLEVRQSFVQLKRKTRQAVLSSLENDLQNTRNPYSERVKSSEYRIVRIVDTKGHIHAFRENTHTEFVCTRQGYFVHPKSCNRFYRCVKFNQEVDDFSVFEFDCPKGLAFDERTEVCVWPGSLSEGSACPGSSEIAPIPKARFECPHKPGYYADPQNCRWFFACYDLGGHDMIAYEFRCPFGLFFDEEKLICQWPWLVPKCGGSHGQEHHVFGVASGEGFKGHGKGYEEDHGGGHDGGYDDGHKGGHDGGYDDGHKGGHDGGYDDGHKGGHDGGYDGGHKGGHDGGYDGGHKGGHDGGYDGGHKGGHDGGYDGGHKGGHEGGYDGGHKGGHDGGYDGGHKGGHDGGYDDGHKGGHDGGYDDGHKGGHDGGYDGGHKGGHDGGYDDGHKGGHDGGLDGGHKGGHDGGYDDGHKGGHDGGYDGGHKGGHDGGYDDGHKGGHDGGYDGGHKGGHDGGLDSGHKGGHDGGYDDGHKGGHDGGYDGGHKGGHDGGYDDGHKGGHDGGYDGGHKGGHDGGYDGGHKGGHDGGLDGGHKGGHDGGYDDGHKGGHDGGYDGSHKGGHDGGYDDGHKGGHDGEYDGGHKGGHDGGYDDGHKGGHDGGYDGGQKGGHDGGYDGGHKGGHDGGLDGGHKGGHDGGYDDGHKGGHDGAYDGGHKGGHDGEYDGGHKGGHDGGYDDGHKGGHDGGLDGGHKGGHDGGYDGGHKGGHDGGYDGSHKGGHDGGYDDGHKGGHDGEYDGGHKGGHDGGYDDGHKGGHDGGYDGGHKGGHDGGLDGGHKGGHDGGYDDGHKGGHDGGYDGSHKGGHDGGYDDGHKGGHDGGYDSGHKGGHDGGYDGGHKGGHDEGLDSGHKNGHDGGYDDGHKGGHVGGYDGGHKGGHDGGYDDGHKGGHDGGYDGGHKGGHDGGLDGGHKGGHDGGYDDGHKGGHDGGYDDGHKGGHDGGYDGGHKGGHDGGLDGGHKGGHDGGYDDGHKGGHDGGYDAGHKGGHDGGYGGGHKGGHDGGYDGGHKDGHDGGFDDSHKGGHDGGLDGGHKGGHDGGYDGGHKDGHDGGFDDKHKGGHDGGYDDGHKGGHDGGYAGGHIGGHDSGGDGGYKGGHDGGYDGDNGKDHHESNYGGHEDGIDLGQKEIHVGGFDDGHKGGHGGFDFGQKEDHGGVFDSSHKGGHDGELDIGQKEVHSGKGFEIDYDYDGIKQHDSHKGKEFTFSQHEDKGGKFGLSQTEDIDIFKQTSELPGFGDKVTSFSKDGGRDGATITIYHGGQTDKSGITESYDFDSGKDVNKNKNSGFVPVISKLPPLGHKHSSSSSTYSNSNRGYSGYSTGFAQTKTNSFPQSNIYKTNYASEQSSGSKYFGSSGTQGGYSGIVKTDSLTNNYTNNFGNNGYIQQGQFVTSGFEPGVNYEMTIGVGKPMSSNYPGAYKTTQSYSNYPSTGFGVTSSGVGGSYDRYTTNSFSGYQQSLSGGIQKQTPIVTSGSIFPSTNYGVPNVDGYQKTTYNYQSNVGLTDFQTPIISGGQVYQGAITQDYNKNSGFLQSGKPDYPFKIAPNSGDQFGNNYGTTPLYNAGVQNNNQVIKFGYQNQYITSRGPQSELKTISSGKAVTRPQVFSNQDYEKSDTGNGFTKEGFTKTGATITGITTAQLGGSGSYVAGAGRPRPRPNPEYIGEKAFEGNVGYKSSSVIKTSNQYSVGLGGAKARPSSDYSTNPSVQASFNKGFSTTQSYNHNQVTTPTPFFNSGIHKEPPAPVTPTPFVTTTFGYSQSVNEYKGSKGSDQQFDEKPFSYTSTGTPTGFTSRLTKGPVVTTYHPVTPDAYSQGAVTKQYPYEKELPDPNLDISISFQNPAFSKYPTTEQDFRDVTADDGDYGQKLSTKGTKYNINREYDRSYEGGSSHSVTPGYSYSKPKQIYTGDKIYDVQQETHKKTLQPFESSTLATVGFSNKKPVLIAEVAHNSKDSTTISSINNSGVVKYSTQISYSDSNQESSVKTNSKTSETSSLDRESNYNRGSAKYTPHDNLYTKKQGGYTRQPTRMHNQDYLSTSRTIDVNASPPITTFSGQYSVPSSTPPCDVTRPKISTPASIRKQGKNKLIIKYSDLHTLLLDKLNAECSCKADPFDLFRITGESTINSDQGQVDLANYDESQVYVDFEKNYAERQVTENIDDQQSNRSEDIRDSTKTTADSTTAKPTTYLSPVKGERGSRLKISNSGLSPYKVRVDEESVSSNRRMDSRSRSAKSLYKDSDSTSSDIVEQGSDCARSGLFRHPKLCNKFYVCHWDKWKKKFTLSVLNCPIHLTFDSNAGACNWPSKGPACQGNNLLT